MNDSFMQAVELYKQGLLLTHPAIAKLLADCKKQPADVIIYQLEMYGLINTKELDRI